MTNNAVRHIVTIAVFSAAAVALGLVKIPSPVGSIALDSAPGYFAAVFFGPAIGAAVGAIGHLASAATGGFPLGGMHIAVAVQMLLWCAIFGAIARRGNSVAALVLASIVAIALNGVASPLLLVPLGLPLPTALQILPFLVFASAVNVVLAAVSAKAVAHSKVRGI